MENDDRPAWFDDGACRDQPLDLFFPKQGEDTSRAKAICARCPVEDLCCEYGFTQRFGIWGGLSERERRRIRRERAQHRRGAA